MLNATTFVYLLTQSLAWRKGIKSKEKEKMNEKIFFNQFLHTHKHDNSSANIRDTMRSVHTHVHR